jgi:hypothetical protein
VTADCETAAAILDAVARACVQAIWHAALAAAPLSTDFGEKWQEFLTAKQKAAEGYGVVDGAVLH